MGIENHISFIKNLKAAGLHGIEAYRSDGKLSGMNSRISFATITSNSSFKSFMHKIMMCLKFPFILSETSMQLSDVFAFNRIERSGRYL